MAQAPATARSLAQSNHLDRVHPGRDVHIELEQPVYVLGVEADVRVDEHEVCTARNVEKAREQRVSASRDERVVGGGEEPYVEAVPPGVADELQERVDIDVTHEAAVAGRGDEYVGALGGHADLLSRRVEQHDAARSAPPTRARERTRRWSSGSGEGASDRWHRHPHDGRPGPPSPRGRPRAMAKMDDPDDPVARTAYERAMYPLHVEP